MDTFTPIEYLKIDVASSFGLDKDDWTTRINWFDQNEAALVLIPELDKKQLTANSYMQKADSPALFYAGICAYVQASHGEAISYPISLDATASGAQILSLLIGCEKSARLCNVIDTGHREDFYTNVFSGMKQRLSEDAGQISRDDAKGAVMTALYGSKAQPRRVFGEGEQLQVFYQTMEQDAPGIWELNQALLDLWNPLTLSHDWIMPDNFHIHTKVIDDQQEYVQFFNSPVTVTSKVNQPKEKGLELGAHTAHSIDGFIVREVSRRCSYDKTKVMHLLQIMKTKAKFTVDVTRDQDYLLATLLQHYEQSGFLSARVLELIDEGNFHYFRGQAVTALEELVHSLPMTPFPVLSVHDCFRVHPNYANDLRRTYNQILYEIGKSDMLSFMASQIVGTHLKVVKKGDVSTKALTANYALS